MSDTEKIQGRHLLGEKDFADVVDADGNPLPPVPKHWGPDLLPAGAKLVKKASTSSPAPSTRKNGEEPPKNGPGSSTDEWVAFAKEKGATDADLLDGDGKPLKKDAIVEKYGTPPAS